MLSQIYPSSTDVLSEKTITKELISKFLLCFCGWLKCRLTGMEVQAMAKKSRVVVFIPAQRRLSTYSIFHTKDAGSDY